MQAFDRCRSGGAISPASHGSWLVVFRERVLQAALIGVAQMVEHQTWDLKAVGSIPTSRSKVGCKPT